jgi:tetratricopeptide (TPR) repeat protein
MYNKILLGLLLIVSVLFVGCAVSTSDTTQPAVIYHPKLPQGIATMEAAEQELALLLKETYWVSYGKNSRIPNAEALRKFVENKEGELGTATNFQYYDTGEFSCRLDGIGVSDARLAIPIFPVYFDELAGFPITVRDYIIEGLPHKISISFKGGYDPKTAQLAHRAADLLFFIQQNWEPFLKEKLAAFEKKAVLYRAIHAKPAMSEEQRKYIVQANAFNERKDYDRAIDLYQKAIEVDPISSPPAYFNLALLSAQTQRFKPAIRYMKQYLLLVPDAKDARSAKDKIYEWEAMTDK